MKKIFLMGFLVMFLFLPLYAFAEENIGYASLQRALNQCEAGKQAVVDLEKDNEKFKDKLTGQREELRAMKEEIESKAAVWNKDTLELKQREFMAKSQVFKEEFVEINEKFNKKRQDREMEIIKELREILDKLAKKRGFTYVFEETIGGILYGPDEDDLTGDIIKEHNKRFKKKK